jgi:hypothetical protein
MSRESSMMARNVTLTGLIQAQWEALKQINITVLKEAQRHTHIESVLE